VAYDPVNQVYLVVVGYGAIYGIFVNASGIPVASAFEIKSGASPFAHFPRVRYSPHVSNGAGGAGGFLVSWHQDDVPNINAVHVRVVAYQNRLVTSDAIASEISASGATKWESGAAIAYSATSRRFLVVWQTVTNTIQGRFVSIDGNPIGSVMPIANPGARDPGVTWNPSSDDFGISYAGWDGAGAFAAFVRLRASDGFLAGSTLFGRAGGTYMSDVDFNTVTGRYVVTWTGAQGTNRAEIDANSNILDGGLVSSNVGGYDSLGVAFNAASGTFLVVGHQNSAEIGAVELNGSGAPLSGAVTVTSGATLGSFYPRATARTGETQWNISFVQNLSTLADQVVATGSSPSPPPPPPPPPSQPPGPGGGPGTTGSRSDFNGDGRADLVWQREDGYLSVWKMNGTTLLEATLLNPGRVADPNWRIAGTGDLNGDGRVEIVWQHVTAGLLSVWIMVGTNLQDAYYLDPPRILSNDWRIVAVADMNRDYKADLIWQHLTEGWLAVWYMDGLNMWRDRLLNPGRIMSNEWRIVGAADMNRDGENDLVWQHTRLGYLSVWYMNGAEAIYADYLNPSSIQPGTWWIRSVIDINADGKPDLIWQHEDGWISVWLMNGINMVEAVYVNPNCVHPDWKIVGPR
jgi:hypothetical protein